MNKLVLLFFVISPPVWAEIWSCTTKDMVTDYEYRFKLEPGVFMTRVQGHQVPQPRPRILIRALPHHHHQYRHVAEAEETSWNTRVFEQLQWSGTGRVQYARLGTRAGESIDFVGQGHCNRIQ